MTQELPLLRVSETASTDVTAERARVHVRLMADRFFSGRAALEKAAELRRFARGLDELGLDRAALTLSGVSMDVSTGIFTRSSSVSYELRVDLSDMEHLGPLIDLVARSDRATLSFIEWTYPESPPLDALRACAERAAAQADVLARALGATLDGVQTVRTSRVEVDPSATREPCAGVPPTSAPARKRASVGSELAGLELAPRRRATMRVDVDYRLRVGRP